MAKYDNTYRMITNNVLPEIKLEDGIVEIEFVRSTGHPKDPFMEPIGIKKAENGLGVYTYTRELADVAQYLVDHVTEIPTRESAANYILRVQYGDGGVFIITTENEGIERKELLVLDASRHVDLMFKCNSVGALFSRGEHSFFREDKLRPVTLCNYLGIEHARPTVVPLTITSQDINNLRHDVNVIVPFMGDWGSVHNAVVPDVVTNTVLALTQHVDRDRLIHCLEILRALSYDVIMATFEAIHEIHNLGAEGADPLVHVDCEGKRFYRPVFASLKAAGIAPPVINFVVNLYESKKQRLDEIVTAAAEIVVGTVIAEYELWEANGRPTDFDSIILPKIETNKTALISRIFLSQGYVYDDRTKNWHAKSSEDSLFEEAARRIELLQPAIGRDKVSPVLSRDFPGRVINGES